MCLYMSLSCTKNIDTYGWFCFLRGSVPIIWEDGVLHFIYLTHTHTHPPQTTGVYVV